MKPFVDLPDGHSFGRPFTGAWIETDFFQHAGST